jgi:hypothetical protein
VAIEFDPEVSDKYNPDICPVKLKASFEHPANRWRGPITVVWYQGGLKPRSPRGFVAVEKIDNGAIFEGTKGSIVADFTTRVIIPNNDDGDFTYYRRRDKDHLEALVAGVGQPTQGPPRPAAQRRREMQTPRPLPPGFKAEPNAQPTASGFPEIQFTEGGVPAALGLPNPEVEPILEAQKNGTIENRRPDIFQVEWLDACKGKYNGVMHGTSSKTHCDFDYSGTMIEQMLLGLVAHRTGKRLDYDPATGRVTNASEANDYLKRTYRAGWPLNG